MDKSRVSRLNEREEHVKTRLDTGLPAKHVRTCDKKPLDCIKKVSSSLPMSGEAKIPDEHSEIVKEKYENIAHHVMDKVS